MQPSASSLYSTLLQRHIEPFGANSDKPTLLLFKATLSGRSNNREWERQVIQALPSDTTSVRALENDCKALTLPEAYQTALIQCVRTLRRFHCKDTRFTQLLADQTAEWLAQLEDEGLNLTQKRQIWKRAAAAMQVLPQETFRPPSDELRKVLQPDRTRVLEELQDLLSHRNYDGCLDLVRGLHQTDYRVIASALAGLLNAEALTQAIPFAQSLWKAYPTHREAIERDLEGWRGREDLALSLQLLNLDPFTIGKLCLLCAGKGTQIKVREQLQSNSFEMALRACAPFPPAASDIAEYLLNQTSLNRANLIRVADYLSRLSPGWFDEEVRRNMLHLIRYFANSPFDGRDQAEYQLAGRLLLFTAALPNHIEALHTALDAFPSTPQLDDSSPSFALYPKLLSSLEERLKQGTPIQEIVPIWRRLYARFCPTDCLTWSPLPSSSSLWLFQALLGVLDSDAALSVEWWPLLHASAYALLEEMGRVDSPSIPYESGRGILRQVHQICLIYAKGPSRRAAELYLPTLFEIALRDNRLQRHGYTPNAWTRPIVRAMATHEGPWRLQQALSMLRTLPQESVHTLLSDITAAALDTQSLRIILYPPPFKISLDHRRQIFKKITASPSFTQNPSYIWAAYYYLYYGVEEISDEEHLRQHLDLASKLIQSNYPIAESIGLGAYKALCYFFDAAQKSSETLFKRLLRGHNIPNNTLQKADRLLQSDSYQGRLAHAAYQYFFAFEAFREREEQQVRLPLARVIDLIEKGCEIIRNTVGPREPLVLQWLDRANWILSEGLIRQHKRADFRKWLDIVMPTVAGENSAIRPIDRVIVGCRLMEALLKTRAVPEHERAVLFARLMQPKFKEWFFQDYPDIQLYSLTLAFDSSSSCSDRAIYNLVTGEYFKLLTSAVVGIPRHYRKPTLTAWIKWSMKILKISEITLHIDDEFRKGVLTQDEHQELTSILNSKEQSAR